MSSPLSRRLLPLPVLGALLLSTALPTLAQEGAPQGPLPVPVETVRPGPVQTWTSYSGRLTAVDSAEIRPRVGGLIEKVLFADGQRVTAGQPLFQIDPRAYAAQAAAAEAALTLARQERERVEKLRRTAAFSQSTLDLRLAQEAAAESALRLARLNLDYALVKAPFAGRVGRAELTAGNLIETNTGAPLLTTVVAESPIYADFNVDEATYLGLRSAAPADIPVELELNGTGGKRHAGTLHAFDNRIDPATGTIRARAIFDNPEGALVPGMFASIRLGSLPQQRIALPEGIIGTDQNKRFVLVVGKDNTATYREVTLGAPAGDRRVILTGLVPGDRVIISGTQRVHPGMPVVPQEAEATPQAGQGTQERQTP